MQLHNIIDIVESRGLTIEDWDIKSIQVGKRYYKEYIIFTLVHDTLISISYKTNSKRYHIAIDEHNASYKTLDNALDVIMYYKERN